MQGQRKTAEPIEECHIPFTAGSLHDLISPVNQMCAMTDLIVRRHGNKFDEEAGLVFRFLQTASDRMRVLVEGMREYVRVLGSPEPLRRCQAVDLLTAAVASLHSEVEKTGAVVTRDELPELYCDPVQVTFALACLIANSIRFCGQKPPRIHVSAEPREGRWLFAVRDSGIGIESSALRQVFGVFWCAQKNGRAGVGLAIARQVMERHGGTIWAESEPGNGATFFFELAAPAPF